MLTLFWVIFWAGLAALAFAAGVSLRVRLRDELDASMPVVDDDAVRTILGTGRFVTDEDEPLAAQDIDEEERRFWSENWDEPEEL